MNDEQAQALAEAVRQRLIEEMQDAYLQGGMSGLCLEGRWDLAMDRLRTVDLGETISKAPQMDTDETE